MTEPNKLALFIAIEGYKNGDLSEDLMRTAVDAYSKSLNAAKPLVMRWVAAPEMPNYDGQYLAQIEEKQDCGNVWKFQKVIECFCNMWVLEENQEITHWMKVEPPTIA